MEIGDNKQHAMTLFLYELLEFAKTFHDNKISITIKKNIVKKTLCRDVNTCMDPITRLKWN
jgi:hypothetical protein